MNPKDMLEEGLRGLGYTPADSMLDSFMRYMAELKRWQKAYSLSSLRKDEDIVVKHFLDSALFLNALRDTLGSGIMEGYSIADIGSGAGFPGIPIKIIEPALRVSLIEPSWKKSAFQKHVIGLLGLRGIEAIQKRAEDMDDSSFDIVLSRALYSIKEFIDNTAMLVNKGGIRMLGKGPAVSMELKDIKDIPYEIKTLDLPFSDIKRYFVIITNNAL